MRARSNGLHRISGKTRAGIKLNELLGLLAKLTAGNATAMAKSIPDHTNVEIGFCENTA